MKTNRKEFIALMHRYEDITVDEIRETAEKMTKLNEDVTWTQLKSELTGFGSSRTCTLCRAGKIGNSEFCPPACMWAILSKNGQMPCLNGENKETYELIREADSPESLAAAYHNRGTHMRFLLDEFDKAEFENSEPDNLPF